MAKDVVQSGKGKPAIASVTGAGRNKTLEQMRQNPKGDWTIEDVEKVCRQIGLVCSSPSRGSHYKVFSKHSDGILTIPARKPVKPFYIRNLIGLADAHLKAAGDI